MKELEIVLDYDEKQEIAKEYEDCTFDTTKEWKIVLTNWDEGFPYSLMIGDVEAEAFTKEYIGGLLKKWTTK